MSCSCTTGFGGAPSTPIFIPAELAKVAISPALPVAVTPAVVAARSRSVACAVPTSRCESGRAFPGAGLNEGPAVTRASAMWWRRS